MELKVYNIEGKETTKVVSLSEEIVGIEPNDHAIYLDVKQYGANQRQGTHKSKQRSEITGSTRKLHKQKGGGGARHGDIKSPLMRGGGRIFGPVPRDYSFKLNKKLKRLARKSALAYKAKEEGIQVVEVFSFNAPRTKDMLKVLTNLNLHNEKTLLVISSPNDVLTLSARNIPNVKVVNVKDLCTYDLLSATKLLFVEDTIELLNNQLA
ncbi:MAG: 50S ribosomal protein L4 [Bacteroidales bacterium]|jgi:large subunit ribosomal protein L4|nr:50S ribosomal protein L4 [Bacteroidales bacterium]